MAETKTETTKETPKTPPAPPKAPEHPADVDYYINLSKVPQNVADADGHYHLVAPQGLIHKDLITPAVAEKCTAFSKFGGNVDEHVKKVRIAAIKSRKAAQKAAAKS